MYGFETLDERHWLGVMDIYSHHAEAAYDAFRQERVGVSAFDAFFENAASLAGDSRASLRIHSKHGFEECGRFPGVGFKHGNYGDIVDMQKSIARTLAAAQWPALPAFEATRELFPLVATRECDASHRKAEKRDHKEHDIERADA